MGQGQEENKQPGSGKAGGERVPPNNATGFTVMTSVIILPSRNSPVKETEPLPDLRENGH